MRNTTKKGRALTSICKWLPQQKQQIIEKSLELSEDYIKNQVYIYKNQT